MPEQNGSEIDLLIEQKEQEQQVEQEEGQGVSEGSAEEGCGDLKVIGGRM